MNPRRRLMWRMKARAANEAVIVATTVEDTTPILEEVAQKVVEEIEEIAQKVVEEIASETAAPVAPKKTTKKRSTRKTATTKKK